MINRFTKIGIVTLAIATMAVVGTDALTCSGGEFKVTDGDAEYCTTSFDAGLFEGEEVSIPDDAAYAKVSMSREGWIDQGVGVNVVKVTADVTVGDETLKNYCFFTTDGGDRFEADSYMLCPLPEGQDRRIRANVDSKEDLQSKVSITFE